MPHRDKKNHQRKSQLKRKELTKTKGIDATETQKIKKRWGLTLKRCLKSAIKVFKLAQMEGNLKLISMLRD